MSKIRLQAYDYKKKKQVFVGFIKDCIFYKTAKPLHFMVLENGYGIQFTVIQQLYNLGCDKIVIKTKTSILESSFIDWKKKTPTNYGHGRQIFLSVDKMKRIK